MHKHYIRYYAQILQCALTDMHLYPEVKLNQHKQMLLHTELHLNQF